MRHGLNLITLLFIFMFVFALISGKAIKPKKKVVYIEKPYIVEKQVIKEVIKEVIKKVPSEADTIMIPTGYPVLANVLKLVSSNKTVIIFFIISPCKILKKSINQQFWCQ